MKVDISIDDASGGDSRLAALLDAHGLKGTFYVPVEYHHVNAMKGRSWLDWSRLVEIAKSHDIGSHTITHRLLTKIPLAEAEYEIIQSKDILQKLFDRPVDKFCYPRGYATDEIREIVKRHYKYARNTLSGDFNYNPDSVWDSTTVHISNRSGHQDSSFMTYAKRQLSRAKRSEQSGNEVCFKLWGHGWEVEQQDLWEDLEKFLGML